MPKKRFSAEQIVVVLRGRIPSDQDTVAAYLASNAEMLSVATLGRRLAAIAKAHRSHGLGSPTTAAIVKATMQGIRPAARRLLRRPWVRRNPAVSGFALIPNPAPLVAAPSAKI